MLSDHVALQLTDVSRVYKSYNRPIDRLLEALPFSSARSQAFQALHPLNLTVSQGEVVGFLGRNGAGKSTLLQLICGTLPPSSGSVVVNGRIAALLELGSGFNPEFTGRENIFLNGALLGLKQSELEKRLNEIIEFSGIGEAVDHPVKTYSSGMFVRLAFSVAVCVDPDVLVIDEALSVGDGAFARKSFDRIMQMKEKGCTILFCSHNLYQVEAICNRAVWLHEGRVVAEGMPAEVISRYENFLYGANDPDSSAPEVPAGQQRAALPSYSGNPRIIESKVWIDEKVVSLAEPQVAYTGCSRLKVYCQWQGAVDIPAPSFAVTIHAGDGRLIASAGSHIDQVCLQVDAQGVGEVELSFPDLPLLKGEYWVEIYLLCEQGIMFYDQIIPAARFRVISPDHPLEQGLFHLERIWGVAEV